MSSATRAANANYQSLITDLYQTNTGDLYQSLMGREQSVLSTIDRVATQRRADGLKGQEFVHLPLAVIWHRMSAALVAIFQDLLKARTYHDGVRAFAKSDRRLYVGLLTVVVAIFLLMITV